MGGSLSEGLRTVFAVVLACLVIGFGFMIWQNLKGVDPANEIYDSEKQIQEAKFTKYDGEIITGQELRDILKSDKFADYAIEVENASTFSYNKSWNDATQAYGTATGNKSNIKVTSNTEYISTKAKYEGSLLTTTDGDIMGLRFEKQ